MRGLSLLGSLTALMLAASLLAVWATLWQQQQQWLTLQQWQQALVQLQQAQRQFFKQQQRFAKSQTELISAGLLAYPVNFPGTSDWRFEPQQHTLLMHADVTVAGVALLLRRLDGYVWQPPQLTVKVVGYVNH